MPDRDTDRIRAACTRFLWYHPPQSPREILTALAAYTDPALDSDVYGSGTLIEALENEIAALLGKPAAVFMPSGTMAQQIALRVWAGRTGNRNVAFHPTCHLEIHEEQGYRELHGLQGILVGDRYRLITLDDLQRLRLPVGALLLELPQREIGGVLPAWEDLTAIINWAREQGIITHLDGARLWECQPFYERSYAEIAGLFDTVYVSFYKILGGIAGAVLAGPEDVITEARVWQRRHGGNLVHLYPYVLAAHKGLHERLDRMAAYHAKAVDIAAALSALPGPVITPHPPHTNMMHVFLPGDSDRLWDAALDIAETRKTWVLPRLRPSQVPGYSMVELTVGDAALDVETDEIAALFRELLQRA
jgi:threonine aldolase